MAHVDHMFRGDESHEDLQFVQDLVKDWELFAKR